MAGDVVALAVGSTAKGVDAARDSDAGIGCDDDADPCESLGLSSLHPTISATDTKTVMALRKEQILRDV
ncbi:MAG: hypothetical protein ABIS44_08170 [Mycobacteriales bacterium]